MCHGLVVLFSATEPEIGWWSYFMFPAARQEGGTTPDRGREWRSTHVLPTTPWSISPCPFGFHPSPWTPPSMLVSRAVQCPLVRPGLAPGSRVGIDVRNVRRGPPLAAPLPFRYGHRRHQLTLPFAWFDSWTPPLGAHAFDSPPPLRLIPWTPPPWVEGTPTPRRLSSRG